MVPVTLPGLRPSCVKSIEERPWLESSSRSRQVCMTGTSSGTILGRTASRQPACHLHQGLIAHGDHLTQRCNG